jgi:diguanylate cyclase (GGDEF)-like protein
VKPSAYVLLFFLWIGTFYASTIMAFAEFISLWYMPAGISIAAFLIFGKRAFIPIFLAVFFLSFRFTEQLQQGFDPAHLASATLFALAHTVPYGLGGLSARHWLSHFVQHGLPSRIIGLLVIYALSALCAALSGLLVWEFTTETYDNIIEEGWFAWWLGDLVGVMVIAPLMCLILPKFTNTRLAWLEEFYAHDRKLSANLKSFLFKLCVAAAAVIGILLLDSQLTHPGIAYFVFFVTIPQLWIVLTERTSFATTSLVVITVIMAFGVGLFNVTDQAITYQFALYMTAAISYFAVAVPALIQRNIQLQEMSMVDLLTNLPTKWLFKTLVNQVVKSSRPNQNHSIAMYNLDHFKKINDDYGEAIGDQVLIDSAQIMKSELRDSEILCRCEQDIFVVFMPNLDIDAATKRANELRHKLPVLHIDDLILPIRGSFGVTQVQFGEEIEETVERATRALHQAKQEGRNKVVAIS